MYGGEFFGVYPLKLHNPGFFTASGNKAIENILGKGENAGNQHFLLFTKCFQLYQRQKNHHFSALPVVAPANAFNVVDYKVLSFG